MFDLPPSQDFSVLPGVDTLGGVDTKKLFGVIYATVKLRDSKPPKGLNLNPFTCA